jgi:alpha-mannosidase
VYFEVWIYFSFNVGEAMGVSQHHDAVSGTEKQEVVFDYAQRLSIGIDNAIVSIRITFFWKYKFQGQANQEIQ